MSQQNTDCRWKYYLCQYLDPFCTQPITPAWPEFAPNFHTIILCHIAPIARVRINLVRRTQKSMLNENDMPKCLENGRTETPKYTQTHTTEHVARDYTESFDSNWKMEIRKSLRCRKWTKKESALDVRRADASWIRCDCSVRNNNSKNVFFV